MNRRGFLYTAAGLILAGCDSGCDKDSGDITGSPVHPPSRAFSPIGTSNVATLTAADVDVIAGAGLTLVQAELVPFDEGQDDTDINRHLPRIKAAVAAARKNNMTFWLTLVNWNGPSQRAQSFAWFDNTFNRVLNEIGPQGLWLEGVSEPDNSAKARQWMDLVVHKWPGTTVQERVAVGASLSSRHYCSYQSLLEGVKSRDIIHSTDCNGALASQLSEQQVKEVTREALDARRKLMIYDTSNAPGLNHNVVRWMADAIRGDS